ncbi:MULTISPECIES: hypothetical protein [Cupriavidus]|uniref:hypothetical protein n=1 Tax=Cupriavidus TaxID=106589 RepID=UPI000375780D|nr:MULTISPECIES: hypothetical protein [Cupriavidus]
MAQLRFHELPAQERDAFASACALHGFAQEDFEVSAAAAGDGDAGRPPRRIAVVRVTGGEAREYRDGPVRWTEAFERDLARDVFGFPLAD